MICIARRNRLAFAGFWLVVMLGLAAGFCEEPPATQQDDAAEKTVAESRRVSVAVARDRAKLMQEIYTSTLEVMHDRYFHGERATVPARALEDVFSDIAQRTHIKANWISVNTRPMSIGHEPKSEFEKQAATQIADGKDEFEQIEKGVYRRATPIALTSNCVSCHTGFFAGESKNPKYAGLVISIPIDEK